MTVVRGVMAAVASVAVAFVLAHGVAQAQGVGTTSFVPRDAFYCPPGNFLNSFTGECQDELIGMPKPPRPDNGG